jgi:hypothetical protein
VVAIDPEETTTSAQSSASTSGSIEEAGPEVDRQQQPEQSPAQSQQVPAAIAGSPVTMEELYVRLSERARRAVDQLRELTSARRLEQMEGAFRNADGTFDIARANQFFEARELPEAEYQRQLQTQDQTFAQKARKHVDRINNACDDTDGTARPAASFGDRTSESALRWEAENGRPMGSDEGHYLKVGDTIRTLEDRIPQLERLRQHIEDPALRQEIDAALARAQQRLAAMKPALADWNARVFTHPTVWNPDGTSRVQPGWPTNAGTI